VSKENVEVVRRFFEAWERRDLPTLYSFYHSDVVLDASRLPQPDRENLYYGLEGVKRFYRDMLAPFDEYYARPEELLDAGDSVVARMRQGGRGRLSGIPVENMHSVVFDIRRHMIARVTFYLDDVEALASVALQD
jgi:ketosteroid isomerase-like protein